MTSKKLFSNVTNNLLYEVWSDDVACCDEEAEFDKDALWVAYSYVDATAPQFIRRKSDFLREFRSVEISESHRQLFRFYQVNSLEALVDAQAKHIEKLQAISPPRPKWEGPVRGG